ncbi:unnamed protein product [Caenorhabditis angaria]|uniref:C-type lectin domain-containing protein n=1 Tax=Caenorhabditis angaria TaxID=860376 RepID=A0A9P1IQ83_9PELO|nr:unnamed protein product [Caenorhabditis angaria]
MLGLIFLISIGFSITFVHSCIPTQQIEQGIVVSSISITSSSTSEPVTSTSTSPSTSTTTSTSTTITTPPPCLDGWTLLDRDTYSWCIVILITSPITPATSDAACKTLSPTALTSGVLNLAEYATIKTLAITANSGNDATIIIGAQRVAGCVGVVGVTATCTQLNSFYWTDGHTTGTGGFMNWRDLRPNNIDGLQDYLMYHTSLDAIDDVRPTWAVGNGAVCGMLAV